MTKQQALADVLDAVEGVLAFTWDDNDDDAVDAIDRLRKATETYGQAQRFTDQPGAATEVTNVLTDIHGRPLPADRSLAIKLGNEVFGTFTAFEQQVRAAIGNTNWECVMKLAREARELEKLGHEPKPDAEASALVWGLESKAPGGDWTTYWTLYSDRSRAELAAINGRPKGTEWRVVEYRKTESAPEVELLRALLGEVYNHGENMDLHRRIQQALGCGDTYTLSAHEDGWTCQACGHENTKGHLLCRNPQCPALKYGTLK